VIAVQSVEPAKSKFGLASATNISRPKPALRDRCVRFVNAIKSGRLDHNAYNIVV
jgi:hypothetical protein